MFKKVIKTFKTFVTSPSMKFVWRAFIDVATIISLVLTVLFLLG